MALRAGLVLASALAVSSCSPLSKIDWSRVFSRDGLSQPERVLAALGVAPGAQVADLGAGGGYFTFRLAHAVGPQGRVYAVEIDARLLRRLEDRTRAGRHENVEVVTGSVDDPHLPDGTIELVLLSSVYHHLQDRAAYFTRLRRDLAPGGRVAVLEPRASAASWLLLLPPGHGVAVPRMREEMAAAGYRVAASYDFLPAHSFEVFAPDP